MNTEKLRRICTHFLFDENIEIIPMGEGFINDTVIVRARDGKYILQRKNSNIFKDIPGMMSNILKVTEHIKSKAIAAGEDPNRATLTVVKTKEGNSFHYEPDGEEAGWWVMTLFIDCADGVDKADTPEMARKGGIGMGRFQALLSDFTGDLADTLPGFHNIKFRYQQWDDIVSRDPAGRVEECAREIEWIESRRKQMLEFFTLIESGQIPSRVTHNDTKISNMLFDGNGDVICMIDLDTVLRAPCLYDFGDAVRSYTNTGLEDDPDVSNVSMSRPMYDALLDGYLSAAGSFLTPIEKRWLPFSGYYITFEQVLRFLMDYIDGDHYYRIKYPDHNLVRARAQYALLESIGSQLLNE